MSKKQHYETSGVYIRAINQNTGDWDSVCFEDLEKWQQEEFLETKPKEWVAQLAVILADRLHLSSSVIRDIKGIVKPDTQ